MKRLLVVLALLLGVSGVVYADSITLTVGQTTSGSGRQTATVFNDSGSTIVSGNVVVWDHDDTEFDRSGYPYVTTTTTADDVWTAGVLLTDSCPDQSLCEIVTKGWAPTALQGSLTEDTVVSTSTTAGRVGDATAGNNACYLGRLAEYYDVVSGATCTGGVCLAPVYVNITCTP